MNISIEVIVLVTDDQDNVEDSHTFESLEEAQLKITELRKEQAQRKQEQADLEEWQKASRQRIRHLLDLFQPKTKRVVLVGWTDCPMCGTFVKECDVHGNGALCRECASVPQGAISEPTHEPRS